MATRAVEQSWTVTRLLASTAEYLQQRDVDAPRLSAEMLLGHVLKLSRLELYTRYDLVPGDAERGRLRDLVRRVGAHEPVQYVVGRAGFFSLEFDVTPDVLIPRPDTETLVDAVVRRVKLEGRMNEPLRVLDVCTGSGAVAVALASVLASASFVAADLSGAAAGVASANVQRLGFAGRVDCRVGDLTAPVAGEMFDVVTANPPYIPTADLATLDRNVRDYEPALALDGGVDGLDLHRRLLADVPGVLVPGGRYYAEMQHDQGDVLRRLAEAGGWVDVRVVTDLEGRDRVLDAARPA